MASEQDQGSKAPESATSDIMGGAPGSDATAASDMAASSTAGGGASSTAPGSTAPDSTLTQASDAASSTAAAASKASEMAVSKASDMAASEAGGASSTAAGASSATGGGGAAAGAVSEAPAPEASAPTSPETPKSKAGSTTGASKSTTGSSKSPSTAGGSTTGGGASRASSHHHSSRKPSGSAGRPRAAKLGHLKLEDAKIGIIGAGKMADALCQGLIHYAKIPAAKIHVASPSAKNLDSFKNYGCHVTKRNYDIFGRFDCNIIFLAFHGHVIKNCYKLGGARPHPLTTNYIPHQRHPIYILSMVSGVSLAQIKACLLNPESTNRYSLEIHRIMMNTAVGQGLGICAVDCEPDSRKLSAPLRQLLSSIAHLEYVPVSQMDAACAIGGSGLAFSYYFINALADGAFKMGLSRKQAIRFASKTAQCAAQTLLESGKHPAELRDTVSAPSGAAIYGIHVLEKNDVASGVTAAVEAAHKRASELASEVRS